MISNATLAFTAVTLLLTLVFPIVLAVWFSKRCKTSASTVLFGALTFFVFQIILRIPLLQAISRVYPTGSVTDNMLSLFLYGLYLSATAALFEEGGRVVIFKAFLKKKGDWKNAVAFGIGHGGFESVALIGIGYVSNLVLMVLMRTGQLAEMMGDLDPLLAGSIQVLADTPSVMYLLAGFERLFAITLHIGFSLLVVYGLASKRYIFVLYAFLAHTLLNLPLVFFQRLPGGTYYTMAYLTVFAMLSLYWILKGSRVLFDTLEQKEVV